ncbi:MAG: HlyD family efflux transporter periplasmic adaptor subunit, partial [Chloroflexi bacterium]|nr:HlyD family efflux transporter periplasmic adaptor subunit [Chloroflexota bacterium]
VGSLLPKGDVCIMKEMEDAWDALQAARDAQVALKNQADKATAKEDGSITQAQDALKAAQDGMATLKAGPDPLELDVKVKQVTVAQANLEKAEADLAEVLEAPDPLDVELRQKDIAAAQAALDAALQRLEGATLKAPIKGVVTAVTIEAGQTVNANTAAMEVADTTVVEMDGVVDEIDVLFVKEGAQVVITMDALPGQTLAGTVSSIASAARTQQGVVSYPIRVQLQVPEGVQLREGLSATADIVIREDKGVLLIPTQAVYGSFQQPTVKLMKGGKLEEQPVTLGNSDDFWVAVTAGLGQDDRILMETAQVTTTGQINVRPGQGGFGGAGGLAGLTGVGGGGQGFTGGQGGQRQGAGNTNR